MEDRTRSRLNRVFVALSDVTRRALLDSLYRRDGQRLGELAENFEMSRQAISKHLEVLEDADLIRIERSARGTLHFLNRLPMRELQSQWLDKYTQARVRVDCY